MFCHGLAVLGMVPRFRRRDISGLLQHLDSRTTVVQTLPASGCSLCCEQMLPILCGAMSQSWRIQKLEIQKQEMEHTFQSSGFSLQGEADISMLCIFNWWLVISLYFLQPRPFQHVAAQPIPWNRQSSSSRLHRSALVGPLLGHNTLSIA